MTSLCLWFSFSIMANQYTVRNSEAHGGRASFFLQWSISFLLSLELFFRPFTKYYDLLSRLPWPRKTISPTHLSDTINHYASLFSFPGTHWNDDKLNLYRITPSHLSYKGSFWHNYFLNNFSISTLPVLLDWLFLTPPSISSCSIDSYFFFKCSMFPVSVVSTLE